MIIDATLGTDGYKCGHAPMYPQGTTEVYSNFTPRSAKHFKGLSDYDGKIVVLGIQGAISEIVQLWNLSFFDESQEVAVGFYKNEMDQYLGPDAVSVESLRNLHKLGYLPLEFRAIEEGSRIPAGIPMLTVRSTVPEFYWLVNYLETILSNLLWKPSTCATVAYEYKRLAEKYAKLTGVDDFTVSIQCHDFSGRGAHGPEDAARSGMGHLASFIGSDTLFSTSYARNYYDEKGLVSISVPATEHAVTSSNILEIEQRLQEGERPRDLTLLGIIEEMEANNEDIRLIAEVCFVYRLITEIVPTGIVSNVCDTYSFWDVVTRGMKYLKNVILNRLDNALGLAKVVVRPDCYSEDTSILTPSGWKLFSDLSEDDLVAQVTDSGQYEFVRPTKIVDQAYSGKMHHFKDHHGKVDLLVTPNHRMVIEQDGRERVVYAEELKLKGNHKQKMLRSASAAGKKSCLSALDRLRIAFQADGSFVTNQTTCVRFSFSKVRKIERLRRILIDVGCDYKEYALGDGKVEFNVKLSASLFQKDFEWVAFDKLNQQWACEFIEELSHWDSSIRSVGRFKFDTTVKLVMDKVELIAIAAGKGILISEAEDNREEYFSKVYTAHIMDNNRVGGQSWTNEVVDYTGRVYCVTVPSGKVLVKRNRCTMVSGNSGDPVEVICGLGAVEEIDSLDTYDIKNAVEYGDADVIKCDGKYYTAEVDDVEYGYDGYRYVNSYKLTEVSEAEVKGAIEVLWETFGGTVTETGHKLLDRHIGLIYGDSITLQRAEEIFKRLEAKGFSSGNVTLGVGSYAYHYMTRDTLGFAMKATHVVVNDREIPIFKEPKTDSKKKSAKGYLCVVKNEENAVDYTLLNDVTFEEQDSEDNELKQLWINGSWRRRTTFTEIRQRLANN